MVSAIVTVTIGVIENAFVNVNGNQKLPEAAKSNKIQSEAV